MKYFLNLLFFLYSFTTFSDSTIDFNQEKIDYRLKSVEKSSNSTIDYNQEEIDYSWQSVEKYSNKINLQKQTMLYKKYYVRAAIVGLLGTYIYYGWYKGNSIEKTDMFLPTQGFLNTCKNFTFGCAKLAGSVMPTALASYYVPKTLNAYSQMDCLNAFIQNYTQLQNTNRDLYIKIDPTKPLNPQALVSINQDLYRQIKEYNSFELLSSDFNVLMVLDNNTHKKERIEAAKVKFQILVQDIVKIMGYIHNRQKEIIKKDTVTGVYIKKHLELMYHHFKDFTDNFFNDFNQLVQTTDIELFKTHVSSMQEALTAYANLFYADLYTLKTFKKSEQ